MVNFLFSFLLSFLTAIAGLALRGAMPFGNGSLLAIDAWGQYYPMLCAMKEAIKSGELFWSGKGLMGFNLWAQNAYYTNSVLWLPLYLLPDKLMIAGINILAAIRIGLAGLTCSIYLSGCTAKKKPRGVDMKLPVFSAAYALSAYTLAFINQFMWMDAVICLPLVIKGIDNIRSKSGGILYIAALSYTIISNFYIGYMVCLFSVVYFAGCVIGDRMSLGQLWEKVWRFLLYSLIAGAISAVYTVPAYYAIRNTAASGAGFGGKIELYHPVTEVLAGFLPFREISLVYGVPNIYCGAVCIALCILSFFIQKNIRKRICIISGCIFFYLSLNCNILDYVWHGFHYPNQLPGRWSFCLIFLIVKQAYVCCGELEKLCREKNESRAVKKQQKPARAGHRPHSRFSWCGVIVLLLFIEVTANAVYTFYSQIRMVDGNEYYQTMEKYEKVAGDIKAEDGSAFYRTELETPWNFNPGQLCGYKGISYYSSTMSKTAYDFFVNMGMSVYAKNLSTRYDKSCAADAFLGVKYRINNDKDGAGYTKNEAVLPIGYSIKAESCEEFVKLLNDKSADYGTVKNFIDENVIGEMSDISVGTGWHGLVGKNEYISGNIMTRSGILVISLPYNEGWSIYIDGVKQRTESLAGYMIMTNIENGIHHIEMKHRTKGLGVGAVISILAIAGVGVYYRRRN